ncbi:unnamed protein product, partial [Owenia fusiformis]
FIENIGFSQIVNIEQCKINTLICDPAANCITDQFGFDYCECKPGYTGDGLTCDDINECKPDELNPCSDDATCINTFGSYLCECNVGHTGDGITCTSTNECTMSGICVTNASCIDTVGSYACLCLPPNVCTSK